MAIPKQTSVWDQRRNSSMVVPPPPTALPEALRALARWRADDPEGYAWVAAGAPTLTEAEHVARFGERYVGHRKRRTAGTA